MTTDIRWFPVNRKALPGVLIGMDQLPLSSLSLNDSVKEADLALGFEHNLHDYKTNVESLNKVMVVNEDNAANLFSWLNTYTKESFPLSQFGRVLTSKDWEIVHTEKRSGNFISKSPWGCVLLGEMLGQSESNGDLSQLPLSRAAACFSFTLAKCSLAYGPNSNAVTLASNRLRLLENDKRFLKRSIKVDELTKIWAFSTAIDTFKVTPIEVVELISDALYHSKQGDLVREHFRPFDILFNLKGFFSDSAEMRVRAFDQFIDMSLNGLTKNESDFIPVAIAAAAFLVGRGSSHIGLLSSASAKHPSCYAWFALLVGIAGPKYWHPEWSKAVRGIEKQIRQSTKVTDPTTSDLCWIEYSWLSETYEDSAIFHNLPKLTPKLLSVEILPGASCQLRLDDEAKSKSITQSQLAYESSKTSLLPLIIKMEELSKIGKLVIQSSGSITDDELESLINNALVSPVKNNRKKNKAK